MVLLDQIVQVLVRPHFHVPPTGLFTSQQPQRAMTRDVTVERHLARHARKCRAQRLAEERLRGGNAAVAPEQEIDGLAVLINRPIEGVPLRFDRNVGLLHPPRVADRFREPVPPLLEVPERSA